MTRRAPRSFRLAAALLAASGLLVAASALLPWYTIEPGCAGATGGRSVSAYQLHALGAFQDVVVLLGAGALVLLLAAAASLVVRPTPWSARIVVLVATAGILLVTWGLLVRGPAVASTAACPGLRVPGAGGPSARSASSARWPARSRPCSRPGSSGGVVPRSPARSASAPPSCEAVARTDQSPSMR